MSFPYFPKVAVANKREENVLNFIFRTPIINIWAIELIRKHFLTPAIENFHFHKTHQIIMNYYEYSLLFWVVTCFKRVTLPEFWLPLKPESLKAYGDCNIWFIYKWRNIQLNQQQVLAVCKMAILHPKEIYHYLQKFSLPEMASFVLAYLFSS